MYRKEVLNGIIYTTLAKLLQKGMDVIPQSHAHKSTEICIRSQVTHQLL